MDNSNKLLSSYQQYMEEQKKQRERALKILEELKPAANRLFSTEDGKKIAGRMIKFCRLLEAEPRVLSPEELQRLQAQKDFVNLFITKLVDKEVFINILKEF